MVKNTCKIIIIFYLLWPYTLTAEENDHPNTTRG